MWSEKLGNVFNQLKNRTNPAFLQFSLETNIYKKTYCIIYGLL